MIQHDIDNRLLQGGKDCLIKSVRPPAHKLVVEIVVILSNEYGIEASRSGDATGSSLTMTLGTDSPVLSCAPMRRDGPETSAVSIAYTFPEVRQAAQAMR